MHTLYTLKYYWRSHLQQLRDTRLLFAAGQAFVFELHLSINCNRSDFSLKSQSASVYTSKWHENSVKCTDETAHQSYPPPPFLISSLLRWNKAESHSVKHKTRPFWSRSNIDPSPCHHSQQRTMCSCARWQIHSRPPGLKRLHVDICLSSPFLI